MFSFMKGAELPPVRVELPTVETELPLFGANLPPVTVCEKKSSAAMSYFRGKRDAKREG
jgi:hypothetical protein